MVSSALEGCCGQFGLICVLVDVRYTVLETSRRLMPLEPLFRLELVIGLRWSYDVQSLPIRSNCFHRSIVGVVLVAALNRIGSLVA
jgi:hypothetical protein